MRLFLETLEDLFDQFLVVLLVDDNGPVAPGRDGVGIELLDGYTLARVFVHGLVDDAEAALADNPNDTVPANKMAGGERFSEMFLHDRSIFTNNCSNYE